MKTDPLRQGSLAGPSPRAPRIWPTILGLAGIAGFIALGAALWPTLETWAYGLSTIQIGLLASLIAGLLTAVGALPAMFVQSVRPSVEDAMMGFGAGVMLAATAFELVLPSVEQAGLQYASKWMPIVVLAGGIGLGGGCLLLMHRLVPHEHFFIGPQSGADPEKIRRIYLFIFAIALHNFPEGLAVGVGFGGDVSAGVSLAMAIGLQNLPEGLVVAIALMALGYQRITAFTVTLLTGLVEPIGGLIGVSAVAVMSSLLPWGLAFAAGAMLFVISHEIIPESHRKGHESAATLGVLVGFVSLIAIDLAMG